MKHIKTYENHKFDEWKLDDLKEYVEELNDKIKLFRNSTYGNYPINWKIIQLIDDELRAVENKIKEQTKPPSTWIIPLKKPEFYVALRKLGIEGGELRGWENRRKSNLFFLGTYSKPLPNAKHIVMRKHEKGGFTWSSYDDNKENFEGVEKIKVSKKEIKEYKLQIEMEKEINKYNL